MKCHSDKFGSSSVYCVVFSSSSSQAPKMMLIIPCEWSFVCVSGYLTFQPPENLRHPRRKKENKSIKTTTNIKSIEEVNIINLWHTLCNTFNDFIISKCERGKIATSPQRNQRMFTLCLCKYHKFPVHLTALLLGSRERPK